MLKRQNYLPDPLKLETMDWDIDTELLIQRSRRRGK